MPLYDYHCPACGHRFEALVRTGSTPACPQCGSSALERQISAPVPPGQSKSIIASARRQAAREGHLSNFSKAERGKLG
ncbi:MAG: zinc ribbon domain-containing protein [Curvibacter lanceolatus]|jgi:putative FmdB family regulatory protein|uniref:FmdB family zinc ribbon protein n=1 Tax=Curvibacter lanceolatus TaxID=86182 RepID=UPI00235336C5|nr:zinc ribbon domain-containing protein [Curvibacter lanceolatus]MBV5293378.1 zinc ribbon domain-containing protein [Curvibacter lanceolatus]